MQANLHKQINEIFKQQPVSIYGRGVYKKDLQSLKQYEWLRSQSIGLLTAILQNQYKELFHQQHHHSQQHQQNQIPKLEPCKIVDPFVTTMLITMGSQSYILESMEGQKLFTYRYLLFPANTQTNKGSHWFLMVYDTVENAMYTMDSASEAVHQNSKIMGKRLVQMRKLFKVEKYFEQIYSSQCQKKQEDEEQMKKKLENKIKKQFTVTSLKNVAKQPNNYDCGIFAVGNIEKVLIQLKKKHDDKNKNTQEPFDEIKINLKNIQKDPQFFKDLRIKYFKKAFQALRHKTKKNNMGTEAEDNSKHH